MTISLKFGPGVSANTRQIATRLIDEINSSGAFNQDKTITVQNFSAQELSGQLSQQTGNTTGINNTIVEINQNFDYNGFNLGLPTPSVTLQGSVLHELTHAIYPGIAGSETPHNSDYYLKEFSLADAIHEKVDPSDISRAHDALRDQNGMSESDIQQVLSGYKSTAQAPPQCFAAGTSIAGQHASKLIEGIEPGDFVLAFDRAADNCLGALVPRRVTRLFRNITTEWLELSCGLTVTPGHCFLDELGSFDRIDAIVARGGSIVTADGELRAVTARRIVYSDSTQHLYEEAGQIRFEEAGSLALAPHFDCGWRTYNFEVEDLHTYIAGGYRVHNDSLGDLISAEDQYQKIHGVPFDPSDPNAVQQLADDIKNDIINAGDLKSLIDPNGDTSTLKDTLVQHDDTISDKITDADGNTTLTDSYGNKFTLDNQDREISTSSPNWLGGTTTQEIRYTPDGTPYVASETEIDGLGRTTSVTTRDEGGNVTGTKQFGLDGSVNETTYAPNEDGIMVPSQTTVTDLSGNVTSLTDYSPDGSQTTVSFDQNGNKTEEVTVNADGSSTDTTSTTDANGDSHPSVTINTDSSGNMTSLDDYNPDGSHTRYNFDPSSGESTGEQRVGADGNVLTPPDGGDPNGWGSGSDGNDGGGGGGSESGGSEGGGGGGSEGGGGPQPPFDPPHTGPGDPRDPLVVQLGGGLPDLTSLTGSTTHFDYDGGGFAVTTGWIGHTAGFLVQTNGDAVSMFGVQSGDGIGDLARLDTNADGRIDATDPAFANLRVWFDQNSNGRVDAGELVTMDGAGIAAIDLHPQSAGRMVNGNTVSSQETIVLTNGGTGSLSDVVFATDYVRSAYTPPAGFTYDPAAAKLPALRGYGLMPDLRVSASLDPALLGAAQNLVLNAGGMTSSEFNAAFESLLFQWAGVQDVDPASKGGWVDARHLDVLLKFYGVDPFGTNEYTDADPNWHNGPIDEIIYQDIRSELEIRFASQVLHSQAANGEAPLSLAHNPFLPFTTIGFDAATDRIHVNLDHLVKAIVDNAPADAARAAAYFDQTLNLLKNVRLDLFADDYAAFGSAFVGAAEKAGLSRELETQFLSSIGVGTVDEGPATGAIANAASQAVIFVGTGDKSIVGGSDNTYVYSSTSGNDTIAPNGSVARLVMSGIASDDVALERPDGGNDLIIVQKNTGTALTISGYFAGSALASVEFSDGASLVPGDLAKALSIEAFHSIVAAAGTGASVADERSQLALYGFTSVIDGSNWDGVLQGTGSADVIFAEGGDKTLSGQGGSDTYVYSSAGGNDIVDDGGNQSKLVFSDIAAAGVTLSRSSNGSGSDLILTVVATGKTVTVKGEFDYWEGGR